MTTVARHGTVFIAWLTVEPGFSGHYAGYWDALDAQNEGAFIEQMPDTRDLHAALRWARSRADRIYVRPDWDSGRPYWAGPYTDHRCPVLPDR